MNELLQLVLASEYARGFVFGFMIQASVWFAIKAFWEYHKNKKDFIDNYQQVKEDDDDYK